MSSNGLPSFAGFLLHPKIRSAFSDHHISIWPSAHLIRICFEVIGIRAVLERTPAPLLKRSNNQIPFPDTLLAWFYGLTLGAERFAYFTRSQRDPLILNCWASLLSVPKHTLPFISHLHLCPDQDRAWKP